MKTNATKTKHIPSEALGANVGGAAPAKFRVQLDPALFFGQPDELLCGRGRILSCEPPPVLRGGEEMPDRLRLPLEEARVGH